MDLSKLIDALKGLANTTAERQDELINQLSKIEKDNPEAAQKKLRSLLLTYKVEVVLRVIILSVIIAVITLAALIYLNPRDFFTADTELLLKRAVENANLHSISLNVLPHQTDTTHFHVVYGDSLHLGKLDNLSPNKILSLKTIKSSDDDFRWHAVAPDVDIQLGMIRFRMEELFVTPRDNQVGPYQQNKINYFSGNRRLAFKFIHERISIPDSDTVISKYQVNIGERIGQTEDIKWHERVWDIGHSPNGRIYTKPITFSHPEWSAIYVATLAMGKYEDRYPEGVYRINGRAFKLRPSD